MAVFQLPPLLRLPREIRDEIYNHIIDFNHIKDYHSLIITNRQLHAEASDYMFRTQEFVLVEISHAWSFPSWQHLVAKRVPQAIWSKRNCSDTDVWTKFDRESLKVNVGNVIPDDVDYSGDMKQYVLVPGLAAWREFAKAVSCVNAEEQSWRQACIEVILWHTSMTVAGQRKEERDLLNVLGETWWEFEDVTIYRAKDQYYAASIVANILKERTWQDLEQLMDDLGGCLSSGEFFYDEGDWSTAEACWREGVDRVLLARQTRQYREFDRSDDLEWVSNDLLLALHLNLAEVLIQQARATVPRSQARGNFLLAIKEHLDERPSEVWRIGIMTRFRCVMLRAWEAQLKGDDEEEAKCLQRAKKQLDRIERNMEGLQTRHRERNGHTNRSSWSKYLDGCYSESVKRSYDPKLMDVDFFGNFITTTTYFGDFASLTLCDEDT